VHLDGARIFNASLYLGIDVKEMTKFADSVMVSLSKGLGAPVGSVLCGSREFVKKAQRYRKMLGGGMRQTGWLCTCGLIALSDENIKTLEEDHRNARLLAEGIAAVRGVHVDLDRVHTNFVLVHFENPGLKPSLFLRLLEDEGVYATVAGEKTIRFVTSKQVSESDILSAIDAVKKTVSKA
jgi:threonine aldolase